MKPRRVTANWDRKILQFIHAREGDNFNCSLIEFHGRKLLAYRHCWNEPQIGLCELDSEWRVKWCELLRFPQEPHNIYQEDPRLFIFRDELHVAFTAIPSLSELIANVGYAKLKEEASCNWAVDTCYILQYKCRRPCEKNWGFFEADGCLWAVYNAARHTILSIDGDRATLAFQHQGKTIPGSFGMIRGGASPQLFGGEFYSFVHFRRSPKSYSCGLYTFGSQPPFTPSRHLPFPVLTPTAEHCSNRHSSQVVYPCGAALLDCGWVISYGAYDRDSRIVAFDINQIEGHLVVNESR